MSNLLWKKKKMSGSSIFFPSSSKSTLPPPPKTTSSLRLFTREEVLETSSSELFLIVVNGAVLNVSSFSHPGGNGALEKYRGKDATVAFEREISHGRNAEKMLNKYVVGRLVCEDDTNNSYDNNNNNNNNNNAIDRRRIRRRRRRRRLEEEEEDVVSNTTNITDNNNNDSFLSSSSSSSMSYHRHHRPRSSASSEEDMTTAAATATTTTSSRRRSDSSSSEEDLCASVERMSDESETCLAAIGGLSACASYEDVNTAAANRDEKREENEVDEYGINFNKPLLQQVPSLKEKYFEWTHIPEPSAPDGTQQRFFEADWMEALTVTAWYVVLLIWLPVIVWTVWRGARDCSESSFSQLSQLAAFGFGLFAWGFKEYAMHRFLFHKEPPADSPFFITFHFLFHGCHHKHPMDALRLVFPPVLAIPIAFGFYSFYSLLCGAALAKLVIAGSLTGYVAYDMTHYACHHLAAAAATGVATTTTTTTETPSSEKEDQEQNNNSSENIFTRYARRVKRRHMTHHYESPDLIFGISQSTWDVVFRTTFENDKTKLI